MSAVIDVSDWRVMRAKRGHTLAFYVIGYVALNDDSIISGAIRKWDGDAAIATTDKQERIRLVGAPKFNRSVENDWERWCNRKGIEDAVDISSRYWKGRAA